MYMYMNWQLFKGTYMTLYVNVVRVPDVGSWGASTGEASLPLH